MANVELATASSILAGNAGWNLPASITETFLEVDADKIVKINTIIATNVHAADAGKFTLFIDGMGAGVVGVTLTDEDTTIYLSKGISIPSGSTLIVLDAPIYLMEGDLLKGGCSAASTVDLFISYEVLDDA